MFLGRRLLLLLVLVMSAEAEESNSAKDLAKLFTSSLKGGDAAGSNNKSASALIEAVAMVNK
jgi:hypothetical protein